MKKKKNIYNDIVNIKEIQRLYDTRIRVHTKNKKKLERFENNYVSNMTHIKNILEQKKYIPGRYNIFLIKEPKVRLIMSQNIIDKVINHVVSEHFLLKIYEPTLLDCNVATRKNKGTDYGIKLIKKYLNEIKDKEFYVLKFDISKYFYNLDHNILKQLIRRKIKDRDALKIIDDIIDSTDRDYVNESIRKMKQKEILKIQESDCIDKEIRIKEIESIPEYKIGKGLPIGNMSSQILAILYLNELDHYIKDELKIKYYIRYMDDGIILHQDKEYLKYCLKEIEKIITKYNLELNKKTCILNIKQGFEFLGFRYIIKNGKLIMKVKNQTKKRFKRKIKKLSKLLEKEVITEKALKQVENSYLGHLHYGNTNKLINNTIKKEKEIKEFKSYQVEIIDKEIVKKEKVLYTRNKG